MPSAEKRKLTDLQERINSAKEGSKSVKPKSTVVNKEMNYVWRMVLELVIGMLLGFGIGYALDQAFETKPLFLIIMSLFGFGAGVKTMIKTAEEYSKKEEK